METLHDVNKKINEYGEFIFLKNKLIEISKLYDDNGLKILSGDISFDLVGGAILDIADGNTPKDYDFIINSKSNNPLLIGSAYSYEVGLKLRKLFVDNGFDFLYDTKFSITFEIPYTDKSDRTPKPLTVQLLKTNISDFEYTISSSIISIDSKTKDIDVEVENFDLASYEERKLIPIGYSYATASQCLIRLPHYKEKGFDIDPETYSSLLDSLLKNNMQVKS